MNNVPVWHQACKSENDKGVGAEFRCVHVERAAYMYDTWHKKTTSRKL